MHERARWRPAGGGGCTKKKNPFFFFFALSSVFWRKVMEMLQRREKKGNNLSWISRSLCARQDLKGNAGSLQRERRTRCAFDCNESIFKVVCVRACACVCFRKWLIFCICARTVTQHPAQPRAAPEQHLLFPLPLTGPLLLSLAYDSGLWGNPSCSFLTSFLSVITPF